MAKAVQKYAKYTLQEMDAYAATEGSCIVKINSTMHLQVGPHVLNNFKKSLLEHITNTKIGYFNKELDGIVLDIKKIKMLGKNCALRFDDPRLHVNIRADFYVFRPLPGAVLRGIVKHISIRNLGVIIYRVFNATIRLSAQLADDIALDSEISFRIKNFDITSPHPCIEGELLTEDGMPATVQTKVENNDESYCDSGYERDSTDSKYKVKEKKVAIADEDDVVFVQPTTEKKAKHKKNMANGSLDELNLSHLKQEPETEREETPTPKKRNNATDSSTKNSKTKKVAAAAEQQSLDGRQLNHNLNATTPATVLNKKGNAVNADDDDVTFIEPTKEKKAKHHKKTSNDSQIEFNLSLLKQETESEKEATPTPKKRKNATDSSIKKSKSKTATAEQQGLVGTQLAYNLITPQTTPKKRKISLTSEADSSSSKPPKKVRKIKHNQSLDKLSTSEVIKIESASEIDSSLEENSRILNKSKKKSKKSI